MADAGSLEEVVAKSYPKMLYHPSLGTVTVKDKFQEAEHGERGFTARYQHQEYPRMLYKKDEKPRIVHSESEEQGLGRGWQREPIGSTPVPMGLESEVTARHVQYLQSRGYRIADVEDARIYVRQLPEEMQQQFLDEVEVWEGAAPFESEIVDSGAGQQAEAQKLADQQEADRIAAKKKAAAERIATRKASKEAKGQ